MATVFQFCTQNIQPFVQCLLYIQGYIILTKRVDKLMTDNIHFRNALYSAGKMQGKEGKEEGRTQFKRMKKHISSSLQ